MTYVTLSEQGNISTAYAISKDCINWERKGIIFKTQDKDCVVFPEKIRNKYYAFNRPEGNFEFSPPHIWISSSKDLQFWGKSTPIKLSEKEEWDYTRVGAGPPPIKTEKGWLLFYHGVTTKKMHGTFFERYFNFSDNSNIYSVGCALFDLQKPGKLIAKSINPIIVPRKTYERKGYVNNVIFPTGLVADLDKKSLLVFSGAGDSVVTVKKILLKDVLKTLTKIKDQV
jgi:beta-1,2-mannobiose phosphorylase / 1,2-beta-oligomannan phosphorylase